jgi:hypothetical protein
MGFGVQSPPPDTVTAEILLQLIVPAGQAMPIEASVLYSGGIPTRSRSPSTSV